MQFKSCFTYQFLIKLLADWQCLFASQRQILPMICVWWVSVLDLVWSCHISSFGRAKLQSRLTSVNFEPCVQPCTRNHVNIEIFVNTSAVERSNPRVLSTSLETTWWRDNVCCCTSQTHTKRSWSLFVCVLRVCCVCVCFPAVSWTLSAGMWPLGPRLIYSFQII